MKVDDRGATPGWRAAAGGVLLALSFLVSYAPVPARWPWHLLAPLLAFGLIAAAVPPLRRTLAWARAGRLDRPILGTTAAVIVATSATLLTFDSLARPDVSHLAEHIPLPPGVPLVVTAVLFAGVNALLEELYFRGVLLDAFASQLGPAAAVVVQAVVFGHAQGYPPGQVGVVLAALYGGVLGALRLWAGGLAAAFVAHVCADLTIFGIVVGTS